ncbi:hypothetical protein IVB16_33135 [Bradyrhizobium sp. 183]|uniref:hypothetical protein n=1 Tax=unclassified Bradyrhizobium TaxID=2631580 RepID=UPI001FFEAAD0|nr:MULTISPECIES: hypothetical protein [unclassified Bradyrhizobium]UPJ79479.1 hypothetical protein IVB17_33130 [Bradyrhizobium sp. 184]UPJ87275.1 hypothetical protein IVB16_33135 [Bradyrhizobium sp. 183]
MMPFRWKNCSADIEASRHEITIRSYFDDVILPALETLHGRIDELGRSDAPGRGFAQADMQDVLCETKLAFALSIQSIWERQLRAYIRGCARELRPRETTASKVEKANWKDLCKLFRELRGIKLESFPSFDTLDILQHLGNACRHGDGESANKLSQRCPDLWQLSSPLLPGFGSTSASKPAPVAAMDIPVDRLRSFIDAVADFWLDAEYIYNESIDRKHPSLEARLVRERAERRWVPQTPVKGG